MASSVLPPWAWGGSYGVPEVLFLFLQTPVLPGQKRKATRKLSRAWDEPPLPAGIAQQLGERKERVEIQGQVGGDRLRAADARGSALLGRGGGAGPCTLRTQTICGLVTKALRFRALKDGKAGDRRPGDEQSKSNV